ncbi:MAG: MBL fold metallo-hydrolase [Chloroflexi bacterium]|nr:MBL fold metallo-hydrolase [Chloroflexota bacterium]
MIELLDGIYGFTGLMVGRVYAIRDPDGLTLIDSGLEQAAPRIVAQIEAAGFKASDIKRIVITHAHVDHGGGAHALNALTGAAIMVSAAEADVMRGTAEQPRPTNHRINVLPRQFFTVAGRPRIARRRRDRRGAGRAGRGGDAGAYARAPVVLVAPSADAVHRRRHAAHPRPALSAADGDGQPRDVRRSLVKTRIAPLKPDALLFGHGPPILSRAAARLDKFVASRGL